MTRHFMRNHCLKAIVLGLCFLSQIAGTIMVRAQSTIPLFDYANSWRYLTNGSDQGTAWTNQFFNDSSWPSGQGLLGYETTPDEYSAPFNTIYSYTNSIITYYYRTHFTFSANPNGVTLVADCFIDDGAVIYLNGAEVGRVRVPAGQNFMT